MQDWLIMQTSINATSSKHKIASSR